MASYTDYTNPANAYDFWMKNIAPKYFNFDTKELHRTGIFGYVNEVMSTVENDSAHAVSIARREFYPTTASYTKSLYKMAALQQLSYPLANPAEASAIMLMKEDEILNYGEYVDGTYRFVIDNNMIIRAGSTPFMFDFPIQIIAKPRTVGSSILDMRKDSDDGKVKYAYTVKYDTTYKNDINKLTTNYIYTRTVTYNGETFLLFKAGIHQVSVEIQTASINSSPVISNVSLDFPFDGKLCNFEVFYSESEESAIRQLTKIPINGNPINGYFCMYSLVDSQTIRISFPENAYFTPKFNSSIKIKIYTTLGSEGNFSTYKGNLVCEINSEDYPYNNMCTITGQIQGSSIGGTDFPTQDDFRNDVITAYATNKTITTDNDLQVYFDSIMQDTRTKVIFQKKRDDPFERLWGAYMILKDTQGSIVPANTLTLEIKESQVDTLFESYGKAIVKPGKVFKYQGGDHYYSSEYNLYCTDMNLNTDINDNITDFCYTNIFLMQIMKSPNMVGYYFNTVNDVVDLSMTDCNDKSYIQFQLNGFNIKRNAIRGENFYKLSVNLQPSIVSSGLQQLLMLTAEELCELDGGLLEIRAEFDGIVQGFEYIDNAVYMIIKYTPSISGVSAGSLTQYANVDWLPNPNENPDDLRVWIQIGASIDYYMDEYGNVTYNSPAWYATTLEPGDVFTANSVIATRCPKDTGILRVICELEGDTFGHYIPMLLEAYDSSTDVYTFSAYLATDDIMNEDGRLEITNGFSIYSGISKDHVSISPTNCTAFVSTFIQYDDNNIPHNYSNYEYVKYHTFTNKFVTSDKKFNFLFPFTFIRSTISYNQMITHDKVNEDGTIDETTPEILFRISEIPLIRSNWLKNIGNIFDLVDIITRNHRYLLETYDLLENNYSIDMKFFNTYGKSRFFQIGIRDEMHTMYKVNIVPKFGVKLNLLSPVEEFKQRFITFVREYIESFNDVTNKGNSIQLMDLITAINNNFPEIDRLEFYGIDNYNSDEVQRIESLTEDEIHALGYTSYIPEFINIYCDYYNNELTPMIGIEFLN